MQGCCFKYSEEAISPKDINCRKVTLSYLLQLVESELLVAIVTSSATMTRDGLCLLWVGAVFAGYSGLLSGLSCLGFFASFPPNKLCCCKFFLGSDFL